MSGTWPCIGETSSFLCDLGNTWNTFMCNFHVSETMHFGNPRSAFVTIVLEIFMLFSIVHRDHIRPRISFFLDRFRDLCTLGFLDQIKINPYPVSEGLQGPMKTISFSLVSLYFMLEGQYLETPFSPTQNILLIVYNALEWHLSLKYIPKIKYM